jgi:hypothetical protein
MVLSWRDSSIVARHEVPGIMRKNIPVPAGRLNFLKRHELSFDDKNLWD